MTDALGRIVTAGGVFAGTNIDDLIILTVLFLSARAAGKPRVREIWAGQYVGVSALVALSLVAALGLTIIPDDYVGLLGLIPFALGLRSLITAVRAHGDPEPPSPTVATGFTSVAAITLANGADNISVYTPMFRTISTEETAVTIAVFAALVGAWCALGSWLGSHDRVIHGLGRYGHWVVPAVFIAIGTIIVLESDVLQKL